MEAEVPAFVHDCLVRGPTERTENRTAARLVDLWDARRARGAEPLFAPTIGAAIPTGRPWLSCHCPGCGVVGENDLRKIDRHRDTPVTSLIPLASCKRCIYKCGFISRTTAEMHMDKIESVKVDQSILGRILDYVKVTVQGTGAGIGSLRRIDEPIAAPLELRNHITGT